MQYTHIDQQVVRRNLMKPTLSSEAKLSFCRYSLKHEEVFITATTV